MKVSDYIKLGIAGGLTYLVMSCDEPKDYVRNDFSYDKYEEFITTQRLMVSNHQPCLYVEYDVDGNGVKDSFAMYKIRHDGNSIVHEEYANVVGFDHDEDGVLDVVRVDTDGNGTLETKIDGTKTSTKKDFKSVTL
ncbi:MAG: hypothetical protein DRJ15_08750 [Bacteroidetes bacterium]|nr:MAG: hypothetical protein DRJ15_08750 [Bacteroidota bacterium]